MKLRDLFVPKCQYDAMKQKADELYYADTGTVESPHLDTSLKNYE